MARPKRICPAGEVFHVLNRSVARLTIFEKPEDYMAFLRALEETWERVQLPIFAMVLMPNHWHFVVRPSADDQVQSDHHLLHVIRYVEPNPLRANLVKINPVAAARRSTAPSCGRLMLPSRWFTHEC